MDRILWRPQPGPQTEFHERPEFEVFFGGAAGGGKTDSLIYEGLRQVHIPSYRAIFFRRTYPELQQVIERTQAVFPAAIPGARWSGDSHTWRFPSGASYRFAHMADPADRFRYQTDEYQYIAFDELTHFPEECYTYLLSRCRTATPGLRCYVRAASNPGNIGHLWVKRRFVELCPPVPSGPRCIDAATGLMWQPMRPGPAYRDPETGLTRAYVPSRVFDNRKLLDADPGYVKRLLALPEHERRALLEGDWDVFAGQVFSEWRYDTHVIAPFEIPPGWRRWRALDWGYRRPFAVLWFAKDPDGLTIVYRELYGCKPGEFDVGVELDAYEVGIRIVEIEREAGEQVLLGYADPACWSRAGHEGPTIAESLTRAGAVFQPADNDRMQGIAKVHELLKVRPDGLPSLVVFSSCPHLIRTLPALPADETHPEDVDTDAEDHLYDALRYGVLSRVAPKRERTPAQPKRKNRYTGY